MTQEHPTLRWVWPVLLAGICVGLIVGSAEYSESHLAFTPISLVNGELRPQNIQLLHTIHNVIITRKFSDFKFELMYEDGEKAGTPWVQVICPSYRAPSEGEGFFPGAIINEINFIDAGYCWDLNPDVQASWFNRKDVNGNYVRRAERTAVATD